MAQSALFRRRSTIAFAATALALVAIKLLFDFYPGDFPVRGQAEALSWPLVGGIAAIGFAGLLAERASGFPDAFADARRERSGWIVATLAGLAYGLLTAGRDYFIEGGGNVLTLSDWAHVPWPWSLPFYTFGAIFLEFLLRLGALCLFVWLIHVVILRRRWRMPVFWAVNLIVSFYEIMPMTMAHARAGEWLAVAATPLEPLYWTNVFEGWLLLRFGWFAPIVFRLAFYLVWHVVYGGLGPF
jgi:hypothetical protein